MKKPKRLKGRLSRKGMNAPYATISLNDAALLRGNIRRMEGAIVYLMPMCTTTALSMANLSVLAQNLGEITARLDTVEGRAR